MLSLMTSFMMTTKWATYQSAIRTWPCMNIVIFTHNLGNWLMPMCVCVCVCAFKSTTVEVNRYNHSLFYINRGRPKMTFAFCGRIIKPPKIKTSVLLFTAFRFIFRFRPKISCFAENLFSAEQLVFGRKRRIKQNILDAVNNGEVLITVNSCVIAAVIVHVIEQANA